MSYRIANEQMGMSYRDVWSTAYVNDLPDSAFLLITPGGTKTAGRTDGAHRFFPVRGADGKIDLPHLRNALAQIPKASSVTADQRAQAMNKAKALARNTTVSGEQGSYAGSAGSGRSVTPEPGIMTRGFDVALEVRADGDGRTVLGRAVPYGQTAPIGGGKQERFVMGAFSRQIGGGQLHTVKLHASHTGRQAGDILSQVGKTVHLAEQSDGLHGAWQLYDTAAGDHVLQLVRTGEVTGLSIGFKALDTKLGSDGAYERHGAHLDHVALTTSPVYAGAQVTAVRSEHPAGAYRTALLQARLILDRVNAPD
jgi:HK97 family phage prohead protease